MENADRPVTAEDVDIIRKAFKALIAEGGLPESSWVSHAESMIRDMTGSSFIDPELVMSVVRK